jgi:hypothetical protein
MLRRFILPVQAMLAVVLVAGWARADGGLQEKPKEPSAAQWKIAKAIARGHAYEKHVVDEKLFPEIHDRDEFTELIARLLAKPTHHRKLENDREAFFDKKTNTIVIYNPHVRDKGTCFRPRAGLKYYEGLK